MRISVVNRNVKVYVANNDDEDELVLAVSLLAFYDCKTFTIEFRENHPAIDAFDVDSFAEMYGLAIVESDKNNIFIFTRGWLQL